MHQFGWLSERREGGGGGEGGELFKFASERGGYPERGEFPQKRGGSNPKGNYQIFACGAETFAALDKLLGSEYCTRIRTLNSRKQCSNI